jgi:hypothetical protein
MVAMRSRKVEDHKTKKEIENEKMWNREIPGK